MQFDLKSSPIDTKTNDLSNGRWYCNNAKEEKEKVYIPSVTTILNAISKGKGFDMWLGNALSYKHAMDYANEAADIGSIVHAYCYRLIMGEKVNTKEDYLDADNNRIIKVDNRVTKRLQGFMDFFKDHKPIPIATELSLYNPAKDKDGEIIFNWAGQVDDVMLINDKRIMLDIKTGKEHQSHALQLTAYQLLWESLFNDEPIHELWGLYLPENYVKKSYKIVKYKYNPGMWLNVYELWIWQNMKKNKKPAPVFKKELPSEFQITEDIYKEKSNDKEK